MLVRTWPRLSATRFPYGSFSAGSGATEAAQQGQPGIETSQRKGLANALVTSSPSGPPLRTLNTASNSSSIFPSFPLCPDVPAPFSDCQLLLPAPACAPQEKQLCPRKQQRDYCDVRLYHTLLFPFSFLPSAYVVCHPIMPRPFADCTLLVFIWQPRLTLPFNLSIIHSD